MVGYYAPPLPALFHVPIVRLTAKNVSSLPAIDGRLTDYGDALLPGFVLRVTPGGHRAYGIRWKGRRMSVGRVDRVALVDARAFARKALERTDRGLGPDPLSPLRGGLTVAQLVERCLEDLQIRPATRLEWERLLKRELAPAFGQRQAAELSRADVRRWTRSVRERSGWTANHAFGLLRRAYSWALQEELVEVSPCQGMAKPYRTSASERVLSAEELWALVRVLDRAPARRRAEADATRLLLLTGVRTAAVLGLRREELHELEGAEPRWVVPGGPVGRSKSGRAHVVPLSPAAVEVLSRHLGQEQRVFAVTSDRSDGRLFWRSQWRVWLQRRVARTLNARRRRAGLPPEPVPRWTLHGLRHSLATHLREDLSVAPDVVSLLLGHAVQGPAVSRVYDRAQMLGERRRALEAWAGWLEGLQRPSDDAGRLLSFPG